MWWCAAGSRGASRNAGPSPRQLLAVRTRCGSQRPRIVPSAVQMGAAPLATSTCTRARSHEPSPCEQLPLWSRRETSRCLPSLGAALGYAYALDDRLEEGVALVTRAVEQAEGLGIRADQALRIAWLGEATLRVGQASEAAALAQRAQQLARERGERGHQARALRLLGDVANGSGSSPTTLAVPHYHEALAIASELGMRPLVAPLPPGPRPAPPSHWRRSKSSGSPDNRRHDVPRDGHEPLAGAGGSGVETTRPRPIVGDTPGEAHLSPASRRPAR